MKPCILSIMLLLIIGLKSAYCQTITFDLPDQKGKMIYLVAFKGIKQDTIFSGQIDEKGALTFTPSKNEPLSSGVVVLFIKPDIRYNFIYSNKENPTLHAEGGFTAQNIHFRNSPENDFITSKYGEQMERTGKIMFLKQGMQLYKPDEKLYPLFQEEKSKLEAQQAVFDTMLQQKSGNLYSARLLALQNLINSYVTRLQGNADTAEVDRIRGYMLRKLDMETLYRSSMWFSCINGLLEIYYKPSPFYGQFGSDIVALLQKTQSQEVFLALANDAATICSQYSWNIDEAVLSNYLSQSGRVVNPQGKLKKMLEVYKLQPGMTAPPIAGINLSNGKTETLLVFFETGCNSCDNEINRLIGNYPVLKSKRIEVVTISSDIDTAVYNNNAKRFPWKTKLCDFKGFAGKNFQNYAIIGTPTMYMIDKTGTIQGKYANLSEIETIK